MNTLYVGSILLYHKKGEEKNPLQFLSRMRRKILRIYNNFQFQNHSTGMSLFTFFDPAKA